MIGTSEKWNQKPEKVSCTKCSIATQDTPLLLWKNVATYFDTIKDVIKYYRRYYRGCVLI